MAQYTTERGICHEGNHEITDAPEIDNVGYKDPLTFEDKITDNNCKAEHQKTYHKLCREHYLEAFMLHYPEAELPAI